MPTRDRAYWQRRCFAAWKDTRLPDEDRHEFASEMLRRPVRSWSDLTADELAAFAHVFRGVHIVDELRRQRGLA